MLVGVGPGVPVGVSTGVPLGVGVGVPDGGAEALKVKLSEHAVGSCARGWLDGAAGETETFLN